MKDNLKGAAFATVLAACGMCAFAATFSGASDNDLANADNWDSSWASTDALVLSPAGYFTAAAGLTISADLPQSAKITLKNFPGETTTVDFGGKNVNTGELVLELDHTDNDRYNYVDATGGFTGVGTLLGLAMKSNIHFRDGVFTLGDGFRMENWFPFMTIGNNAEVVISKVDTDWYRGFCDNCSFPEFTIEGGTLRILARDANSDPGWKRMRWSAAQGGVFKILNGGRYIDESDRPQDVFFGTMSVEIDNGSILAENSLANRRNLVWASSGHFAMNDGTLKVAQFYTGQYQSGYFNNEVDQNANKCSIAFTNSTETFAFAPSANNPGGGFVLSPRSACVSVTAGGAANVFTSGMLVIGGTTNSFSVGGGVFDVSNQVQFVVGDSSSLTFSGDTTAYLKTISATDAALRSRVAILGTARVSMHVPHGNDTAYVDGSLVGGPEGTMEINGGSLDLDAHYLKFGYVSNSLEMANASMTGGIHFAANDARALVGDGAIVHAVADGNWEGYGRGLLFDSGVTNAALVISNGTYRSDIAVFKQDVALDAQGTAVATGYTPFTGCPGCRIEFRGNHPKFLVTSAKTHGASGAAWVALVLGEMVDRSGAQPVYTNGTYALDNPVRLRFVLPEEGYYVEAPVQNTCYESTLLGGNAEFEFDLSSFKWPKRATRIPLVYDKSGFTSGGRSYINVDGLNETNAARLPSIGEGIGRVQARLVLSPDGKTLNLAIPGISGTMICIR